MCSQSWVRQAFFCSKSKMQLCYRSTSCGVWHFFPLFEAWRNRLSFCRSSALSLQNALARNPLNVTESRDRGISSSMYMVGCSTTRAALGKSGLVAGPSVFEPRHMVMHAITANTDLPLSLDLSPPRAWRCLTCRAPQTQRLPGPLLDADLPGRNAILVIEKTTSLSIFVKHDDSRARAYSIRTLGLAKCCGPTFLPESLLWQLWSLQGHF